MEANKIIITGAATRMGAAIAKKLSGPNVEIVIHYNKSKLNAEKLQKELKKNKYKGQGYKPYSFSNCLVICPYVLFINSR